jgi:hypothetical protein
LSSTKLIIILVLVLAIGGGVIPGVKHFRSKGRTKKAEEDLQVIASAIIAFNRDTHLAPFYKEGDNTRPGARIFYVLTGNGDEPGTVQSGWLASSADSFYSHLALNKPKYPAQGKYAWKGPYLKEDIGPDPWGKQYLCNVAMMDPKENKAVWVLSAGPNRTIDTPFSQSINRAALGGDDVGFRVK